jgi:hypothetical protein
MSCIAMVEDTHFPPQLKLLQIACDPACIPTLCTLPKSLTELHMTMGELTELAVDEIPKSLLRLSIKTTKTSIAAIRRFKGAPSFKIECDLLSMMQQCCAYGGVKFSRTKKIIKVLKNHEDCHGALFCKSRVLTLKNLF